MEDKKLSDRRHYLEEVFLSAMSKYNGYCAGFYNKIGGDLYPTAEDAIAAASAQTYEDLTLSGLIGYRHPLEKITIITTLAIILMKKDKRLLDIYITDLKKIMQDNGIGYDTASDDLADLDPPLDIEEWGYVLGQLRILDLISKTGARGTKQET